MLHRNASGRAPDPLLGTTARWREPWDSGLRCQASPCFLRPASCLTKVTCLGADYLDSAGPFRLTTAGGCQAWAVPSPLDVPVPSIFIETQGARSCCHPLTHTGTLRQREVSVHPRGQGQRCEHLREQGLPALRLSLGVAVTRLWGGGWVLLRTRSAGSKAERQACAARPYRPPAIPPQWPRQEEASTCKGSATFPGGACPGQGAAGCSVHIQPGLTGPTGSSRELGGKGTEG